jgi:ribosome-binding factor A
MKKKREGDNIRTERVASTLRDAVQQVLAKGLSDPRARGLITITRVTVSPDLKNAEILVSILPDKHQDLTMHALRHAARHIRRQAGELMALHTLPELVFKTDDQLKQQAAVYQALAKVREEREQKERGSRASEGSDGEEEGGPGAAKDEGRSGESVPGSARGEPT